MIYILDGGSDNNLYGDFHTVYAKIRIKTSMMYCSQWL